MFIFQFVPNGCLRLKLFFSYILFLGVRHIIKEMFIKYG